MSKTPKNNPSKAELLNAEIADRIRSGKYYKEAWDWYAFKYIYPVSQRSFFIFITLAALLVTVASFVALYNFYPLKIKVPIAISNPDMTKDYAALIKMPVPQNGDVDMPIVEYLAQKYVENIETYHYGEFDKRLVFLKQFSSSPLYIEIEKRYDIRNLDSLVLKFRDHTTRDIRIISHEVERGEGFQPTNQTPEGAISKDVPYRAYVTFEAEETNFTGVTTRKWEATVDFTMSPIIFDKVNKKFPPLDFRVNSYSVKPLS